MSFANRAAADVDLVFVQFSNAHTVYRDRLVPSGANWAEVTYLPIWLDRNRDGDAKDWFTDASGNPFAGDITGPICYTSGTQVSVSRAEFYVTPPHSISLLGTVVYGREQGALTDAFTSTSLAYDATGSILIATMTGVGKTHTTIAADLNYKVDWRIEQFGTPLPITAGTSENPVYWVLAAPTGNFPLSLSFVDIGCRWAHGLGSGTAIGTIADAIFIEFQDKHVVRSTDVLEQVVAPVPMTYWQNWHTAQFTVNAVAANALGMLHTGDGRCQAWSTFFIRCLHAVGLDPPYALIEVTLPPPPSNGMIEYVVVPNWNPAGTSNLNGPFGPEYPYINIPNIIWGPNHEFIGPAAYAWRMADFADVAGITAQGAAIVPNPASMWGNHAIVKAVFGGTEYYDPSYGVTRSGTQGVDDAFQAFGRGFGLGGLAGVAIDEGHVNLDLDGDMAVTPGKMVVTPAIIFKANPAGIQIIMNSLIFLAERRFI